MTDAPRRLNTRLIGLVSAAASTLLLSASTTSAAPTVPLLKPSVVFTQHTGSVNGVALAPDGRTAATASSDRTIRFWDTMSGAATAIIRHTDPLTALAFSPDGGTLAVADRSPAIILFDVASRKQLVRLPKPDGPVQWMAFGPDGRTLATISSHAAEAVLWDVAAGAKRLTLKHRNSYVTSLAFTQDGKRATTAGTDEVVRFWDLGDGSQSAVGKGHNQAVHYVAFAPDGKTAVTAGEDKTVKVWDAITGKCLNTWEGHGGPVRWVAYARDGRSVVSLGLNDAQVTVWDAANEKPRGAFRWFRGAVSVPNYNSNIALSADGRMSRGCSDVRSKIGHGLVTPRSGGAVSGRKCFVLLAVFASVGGVLSLRCVNRTRAQR